MRVTLFFVALLFTSQSIASETAASDYIICSALGNVIGKSLFEKQSYKAAETISRRAKAYLEIAKIYDILNGTEGLAEQLAANMEKGTKDDVPGVIQSYNERCSELPDRARKFIDRIAPGKLIRD